jgi:hypothetical protein
MSSCPKCGAKIREGMNFCPSCGASLKAEQAPAQPVSPPPLVAEKAEKHEKQEKGQRPEKMEKEERHEVRHYSWIGPFTGGLILLFAGLALYFAVTATLRLEVIGALFFVLIGIIIIVGAIYAATIAAGRHPQT